MKMMQLTAAALAVLAAGAATAQTKPVTSKNFDTYYNVCRGTAVVMRDLLDRLLAMSTVTVTLEQDATRMRPNDLTFLAGDASRLQADTGWSPQIPLQQTLADLLDFWRQTLARAS